MADVIADEVQPQPSPAFEEVIPEEEGGDKKVTSEEKEQSQASAEHGQPSEPEHQQKGSDTQAEAESPVENGDKPKTLGTPPTQHKIVKDELSDKQRKAKIEELRKKKIGEYKKKEDDRRKAVLERKKRLDEEERAKNDALLKKLALGTTPTKRPVSAPARRAVSFSSLSHLQRTRVVAKDIDIENKAPRSKEVGDQSSSSGPGADRRRTLPPRPASAIDRKKVSSLSHDDPSKAGISKDAAGKPRPRSAIGHRSEPKTRQSISNLPNRPASAAGNRAPAKLTEDRLRSLAAPKTRPSMPSLPAKPLVPITKTREMKKSSSVGNVIHKGTHERPKGPMQPGKKTQEATDLAKQKPPSPKTLTKPKSDPIRQKPAPKTTDPGKPKDTLKNENPARKNSKNEDAKKGAASNEEQAKKLLAEKRRQVKEEAERKALEEKGKAEEARIKREEEQRLRAEELIKEQERQKQHLEELQREAEEREMKAQEEKERKEQEEREQFEAQKKQRQEDIDRKAQEEVDRRAKEREIRRQQEEADRLERKKRVQEILGARIRGSPSGEAPVSPTPMSPGNSEEAPGEKSPPMIDSAASARDRAQKLLEKSQRKSNESENSIDEDEKGRHEESNNISHVAGTDANQGAIQSNGDNHIDDLVYEPESSLIEADMQALRELEQERRGGVEETETKHDESMKNGAVGDGAFNNNMQSNSQGHAEEMAKEDEAGKLWNEAEKIMAENEDNNLNKSLDKKESSNPGNLSPSGEENRLWQLVEGRIELEECF